MKKLFWTAFILMFTVNASGQICDSLIKKEVDKFTEIVSYSFKEGSRFEKKGEKMHFIMTMDRTEDLIGIFFLIKERGFGCVDDGQMVYFIFSDGSKEKYKNSNSFTCDGMIFLSFGKNYKPNIPLKNSLTQKKITAIRVESRSSSFETEIPDQDGEKFKQAAECLFNLKLQS